VLKFGWKKRLVLNAYICQVSNDLRENRRALFHESRNVVKNKIYESRNVVKNKILMEWLIKA